MTREKEISNAVKEFREKKEKLQQEEQNMADGILQIYLKRELNGQMNIL